MCTSAVKKMSVPDYCREMEHLSVNEQLEPIDNNKNKKPSKKPYAAFLIDRPFNNNQAQKQREDNSKDTLMNCMRYRLRIVSAQQVETGMEIYLHSNQQYYKHNTVTILIRNDFEKLNTFCKPYNFLSFYCRR